MHRVGFEPTIPAGTVIGQYMYTHIKFIYIYIYSIFHILMLDWEVELLNFDKYSLNSSLRRNKVHPNAISSTAHIFRYQEQKCIILCRKHFDCGRYRGLHLGSTRKFTLSECIGSRGWRRTYVSSCLG
jgi:hypothetical protein